MKVEVRVIKVFHNRAIGSTFSTSRSRARALVAVKLCEYTSEITGYETTQMPELTVKDKEQVSPSMDSVGADNSEPKESAQQTQEETDDSSSDGEENEEPQTSEQDVQTLRATQSAVDAAELHGVDLSKVTGTGEGGRITKLDVIRFVEDENSVTGTRDKSL